MAVSTAVLSAVRCKPGSSIAPSVAPFPRATPANHPTRLSMPTRLNVLVVGGSGYLGQFLVQRLAPKHNVLYTFLAHPLPADAFPAQAAKVDVTSVADFTAALQQLQPQVVINCAAISQPAVCEKDYSAAAAINVPSALLQALDALPVGTPRPFLIHISTDQVYDGTRPNWTETDPTQPVNAYGRSKLAAEQLLLESYTSAPVAILRSSLIYGPQPPVPVGRPLFLQFVDQQLRDKAPTSFFTDEFRCPVYVEDICDIVEALMGPYPTPPSHPVYNMGGPQRLSRVDMAVAVAQHRGYDQEGIQTSKSADVQRGYDSPLDISMDMARLTADLPGVSLTPFAEALKIILV